VNLALKIISKAFPKTQTEACSLRGAKEASPEMKKNVLIIGAGGVAQVVAHKCAQNSDVLGDIHIASRTVAKCQKIVDSVREKKSLKTEVTLEAHALDAMDVEATKALIAKTGVEIVINVGSAFVNMSVLQACMDTGVAYMDTAIHEDPKKICETPPWYANYEWKRAQECKEKGVTAILGIGFDPGVVNAYARLAKDDYLDKVTSVDIVDINAGSHGRWFSTNFDPEINFREFTGVVYSWQNGQWQTNTMFEVGQEFDLPVVGKQKAYMTGHDEVHSLSKNMDGADVRFWMGFGDHYINVFTVLKNLGLLSEKPVKTAEGLEVVPLKVVKAVLPDPSSLAPDYTGKTCIGDIVKGIKDGKETEVFIYNVADHKEAYNEVGSQGISYTAGVPPVAAAMLIASGVWDVKQMVNVEELDPKPFLDILNRIGLPTRIKDANGDRALTFS
jgi:saccharopine dehydrogenase-like NADP-dependent oxidoreductase